MGEGTNKKAKFFFNGEEISSISEGEIFFNFKENLIERDCEINTTYGTISFRAVFTEEQWAKLIEISNKAWNTRVQKER